MQPRKRRFKRTIKAPSTTILASTRTPDYNDSLINGYNPNIFFTKKGFHTVE